MSHLPDSREYAELQRIRQKTLHFVEMIFFMLIGAGECPCGKLIPPQPGRGRPRDTCSPECARIRHNALKRIARSKR